MEVSLQITSITPAKDAHAHLPATFFPPYAVNALREALTEAEYIVAKDNDLAVEQRAGFVIERCEYAICRLREALDRADGRAWIAAQLAERAQ